MLLQQHEVDCKFQPITCEKCKELVSKQKMEVHKNRECPQRIIKCDHCHVEMPQAQKKVSGLGSFLRMVNETVTVEPIAYDQPLKNNTDTSQLQWSDLE